MKNRMEKIEKSYQINSPVAQVMEALTNKAIIEKWSGAAATMENESGGQFSLWGGSIQGRNVEISKRKIIQKWKEKSWEEFSKVTFSLKEEEAGTTVHLLHEEIPANASKSISKGWDEYYFGPLITFLESKKDG